MYSKCIKSIIKNIEYIIIDGNSSDKTKEIIEKFKSKIDIFISEKTMGYGML